MTLRARRRRRARLLAVLVLLVVCAVIGAVAYFVRAPFLRIQTIQVTGTDPASQAEIIAFVTAQLSGNYRYFIPRDHVWEYPRLNLRQSILTAFPRLADVEPKLQSFTALSIQVSERLPKALWCGEEGALAPPEGATCRYLDQHGAAYAPAATTSALAYMTYYGALDSSRLPPQFLTPQQYHALVVFIDALVGKAEAGPASSAVVDAYGNVTLHFQNGFELIFTLDDAFARAGVVLHRFGIALQSSPFEIHTLTDFEYLDLRFGDSLYYKLKGSAAVGASTTTQ